MTELVTVTVDDRPVQVPKGTGLVETAAAAGVEIPVFCYEPRLGPPVGACRMCLVEVEGMPKLQAGCTLTAQEGMVVRTAHTSALAAEGQNATLEFILINHPLDCPVCDKGGECPLQDLTFRYGPAVTRMTFAKRTFDKPIPLSPTIALDRERCILCYRCTRFSEQVAEDGQLVARNRGAQSVIATFQDLPYRAPFSGNVIELCPVGALTSTLYRFQARPWEIQNVATVCGLCPVGCNITATVREGKVKRVLSRNHPEIDRGWICDRGRFTYPALAAADRLRVPLRRAGGRRLQPVDWEEALDEMERMLRAAEGRAVLALSGTETVELAYALSVLVRQGASSHAALLPDGGGAEVDPYRAPLSAIADAQVVVVVADEPVLDRAPVVDLWIRAARRAGAEVVTIGPTGTVRRQPGDWQALCGELADPAHPLGARLRTAERAALVWSASGGASLLADLAHTVGFHERPGCGAYYLPATPNGRAVTEAWAAAGEETTPLPDRPSLLLLSGDEAARDPRVRRLAGEAEAVVALVLFAEEARGLADLVLPATSHLEREGTVVNLEGRPQRLRRTVPPPTRDELDWLRELGARLALSTVPPPHLARAGGALQAPLPARPPAQPRQAPGRSEPVQAPPAPKLRLVRYRALFSGPLVDRVPELGFQRAEPEIELAPEDADKRAVADGDPVSVRADGVVVQLRARLNRRLVPGVVRAAAEHVQGLPDLVEVRVV